MEILHPQARAKPKLFDSEPRRQGGSLSARCECGWYCMHNHKAPKQAWICVARHNVEVQNLDIKPLDLVEEWGYGEGIG